MAASGQSTGAAAAYSGILASANFEAVLMDKVAPMIRSLVVTHTEAFKMFKENKKDKWDLKNRRLVGTIQDGVNGSFVGVAEGGTLPGPGKASWQQWNMLSKYVYSLLALTGQVISASKGRTGALLSAVEAETKALVTGIKHNGQRMLWGNGTGYLCKQSGAYAALGAATVGIDQTYQTAAGAGGWPVTTRPLLKNMKVCWGTEAALIGTGPPTQTFASGSGVIKSVPTANTFTLTSVTGTNPAAGDYFVLGDGTVGNSLNNEFMGFLGIANLFHATGTTWDPKELQGISSATEAEWAGLFIQLASGACTVGTSGQTTGVTLAEDDLDRAVDKFYNENGKEPNCMICNQDVRREYKKLLVPDRRFAPLSYQGGAKSITYSTDEGDIPIIRDRHCWPGEIVMMSKDSFWYSWMQDFGWITTGLNGGGIFRQVSRKDEAEAVYGAYGNFGTDMRREILRLRDITTTAS